MTYKLPPRAPIVVDCVQGSGEWHEARLGIPTASRFKCIVTPTGKISAQRVGYRAKLNAAFFVGEPDDESLDMLEYIQRGRALEPQALSYYRTFVCSDPIRRPGLIYRDSSRLSACSPDGLGLLGDRGGLELKCPKLCTHLEYLEAGRVPTEYVLQVQGSLWVSGADWWDFMSFYPGMPPLVVRSFPDKEYQEALDMGLPIFIDELLAGRERLLKMGVLDPHAEPPQVDEQAEARAWADSMGMFQT